MAVSQIQGVPEGLVEEEIPQQQNSQAVQGVPEGLVEEALPPAANPTLDAAKANIAKYPVHEENHWMGKLVPQAALPAMQKFTESAPIKTSEELGQKGSEYLGEVGAKVGQAAVTGADILSHPIRSLGDAAGVDFSNPMRSQFEPHPVTTTPEQIAEQEHPMAMQVARGGGRAVGKFVGGFADPRMAALAIATGAAGNAMPILGKIASGAFGTQMGAHAIGVAADLATNWNKYTPEQRSEMITDAGLAGYFAADSLGHLAPEGTADTFKNAGSTAVRGVGNAAEFATTPAAIGTAAGGAVDALGTKLGVPMHGAAEIAGGYMGREMARTAGRNPNEPLVRFPRMTNFGKQPEGTSNYRDFDRQDRSVYGPPAPPEPAAAPAPAPKAEAPVDKNHETLKAAYDKANSDFQKAHEARQAYATSIEQGFDPPAGVQKAYDKAEKALDEAAFHLQTYEDKLREQPKSEPISGEVVSKEDQFNLSAGFTGEGFKQRFGLEPDASLLPFVQNGLIKQNEEGLWEIQGADALSKIKESTVQPPKVIRGGQHELPGGGVMGKPLQLPGEVPTEDPAHANVPDIRARMVPAKEAAGAYEPEPEHPMTQKLGQNKAAQQVTKAGDLIQQGLGGKALEPKVPLREQVQGVPEGLIEEPLPPVKEEAPAPVATEAEPTEHPRNLVHANGEALSNAIPKTPEGVELLQKLHDLSNVELRQLAINAGEDMGQLKIGRGKASGNISRPEVFERMLKNHSAEDLGRMVDEGKHQPSVNDNAAPVHTNGSGESAASQEAINRQASEKANGVKRYRVDSRTQNAIPLIGSDAVDATAGKFEHIVQVDKNGNETILDSGANARPLTKPVGATQVPKAEVPKTEAPKGTNSDRAQEIHEKYNEQTAYANENLVGDEKKDYLKAARISRDTKLAQLGQGGGAQSAVATPEQPKDEPKPVTEETYQSIADNHNKYSGFSYNSGIGFVRDLPVFSVGGEFPDITMVKSGRKLTAADVKEFMERPEVKEALKDPQNSVGGWNYKGNSHLEISKMFTDKDEAIAAAKAANQTAIYDHANRTEIQTGGTAADEEAAAARRGPVDNIPNKPLNKTQATALAEKHMAEGERFGTERGRSSFIQKLMKMPAVREWIDIAKLGEGGRKWYDRSVKAFDALAKVAPEYFLEGDRQKFTNFVASLSPQQSVKMNLQEALHVWSKYVDMGRPTGKVLDSLLDKELTLAEAKKGNAKLALSGEDMWPDLSDNRNFKVPSFAENLRGFWNKVTNDGWQAAFAGLKPEDIQTATGYHPLSVLTRAAAEALGWEPAEAQAAIWAAVKALTEKGEKLPEKIRDYSEDFADLMAFDDDIRSQLSELGVPLEELDEHLREIERKPEVTAGTSPTTEDSVRKLAARVEKQRGKGAIPKPKDSGLFDRVEAEKRHNFFKGPGAENEGDVSFNPDELSERVTPDATNKTRKMSNEELLQHGFTQDEIDAGKHLPSVGGGSGAPDAKEDEKQPLWHSKAAKIAEEKLGSKGSGDQFLATLKNNGVKGDELQALGLEDYLKGKDKVSKQELLDHIDKNQIKLSETTKGETDEDTPELKAKKEAYAKLQSEKDVAQAAMEVPQEKAKDIYNEVYRQSRSGAIPFSFWSLLNMEPSEQARMLERIRPTSEKSAPATQTSLFAGMEERAPKGTKAPKARNGEYDPWPQEKYDQFAQAIHEYNDKAARHSQLNRLLRSTPDPNNENNSNRPKFEQWTLGHQEGAPKENYREKLIQLPMKEGVTPFVRASHFEEPNVVAHTRYDDRTDADGKKNLFVEEVQSDWHQKGREEGYQIEDPSKHFKAEKVGGVGDWTIFDKDGGVVDTIRGHVADTPEEALQYYKKYNYESNRVPDAPFKNDWHELVMKRMLREAAEKGYDRLSWTTGQQQADRYNLQKSVSKVEYNPETNRFVAWGGSGRQLISETMPFDKVKDYIGNELASKLNEKVNAPKKEPVYTMEYDPEQQVYNIMKDGAVVDTMYSQQGADRTLKHYQRTVGDEGTPSLSGLDLKVGGEWAKALYDRAIPNFVNKYLKKFNVKVGETELPKGDQRTSDEEPQEVYELRIAAINALRDHGAESEQFRNADKKYQDALGKKSEGYKVHSIDITPEMKKELKKSAPIAENENEKSPYDVA